MDIKTEMISFHVLELRVPFSVRTSQHVKNQSSCEEYVNQRAVESRGFSPGTLVSSHRDS